MLQSTDCLISSHECYVIFDVKVCLFYFLRMVYFTISQRKPQESYVCVEGVRPRAEQSILDSVICACVCAVHNGESDMHALSAGR